MDSWPTDQHPALRMRFPRDSLRTPLGADKCRLAKLSTRRLSCLEVHNSMQSTRQHDDCARNAETTNGQLVRNSASSVGLPAIATRRNQRRRIHIRQRLRNRRIPNKDNGGRIILPPHKVLINHSATRRQYLAHQRPHGAPPSSMGTVAAAEAAGVTALPQTVMQ